MSTFAPLPHQQAALDKLKDLNSIGLMWTMGRGKTKTAIDIATYKFSIGEIDRVLLVAPNYVHTQWVEEQLPLHCDAPYLAHAFRTSKATTYMAELRSFLRTVQSRRLGRLMIFAVHLDAFSHGSVDEYIHSFCERNKTLFIIDEASRIKNPKAKRTTKLTALHRQYGGPAIIMTGTALAKRPADVWSLCNFLDPRIIPLNYTAFEKRHTVMMQKTYNVSGKKVTVENPIDERQWALVKRKVKKFSERGYDDIDVIHMVAQSCNMRPEDVRFVRDSEAFVRYRDVDKLKAALSSCFSFLEPNDDVKLPPRVCRTIEFELSSEQKTLITQLKKYAVAQYGDAVLTVQNKAALQTKALQICGGFFSPIEREGETVPLEGPNAKLDYIMNSLDEIGEAQFLVFAAFTEEIKLLSQRISKEVSTGSVYGSTSREERGTLVEDFKRGKIQCLVCNPVVAGYGLNLQNALLQYWYSRNYVTEARIQAEGRSHRIGITESPVYIDLTYNCQFERAVLANNKDGQDLNDYFNNSSIEQLLTI